MVTRHQFLTMLHDLLRPHVYLEIGVQYGLSLNLAVHSEWAIGVDPEPLVEATGKQSIYKMTSAEYFNFPLDNAPDQVDLAFIDGSHLWEDAALDFLEIIKLCGPQSVIVFDDVLPYNKEIAGREPLPGDWTGDVWRTMLNIESMAKERGVNTARVNTFPTGTFAVWGLAEGDAEWFDDMPWKPGGELPVEVMMRIGALEAQDVIDRIKEDLCASQ